MVGKSNPREQALRAIEKLHQQDVAATLAGDPNKLAELWADDAVAAWAQRRWARDLLRNMTQKPIGRVVAGW